MANRILTKKLLEIEGIPELTRHLDRYLTRLDRDPATLLFLKREAFMKGALMVRDEVRDLAPVGPTGNLKKGVFAAYGDPRKPNVLVGVNYRISPHAHLVEYGTSGARSPKKARLLRFTIDGRVVFTRSVAPMPRQPYFRPGVTAARPLAARVIAEGLRKALVIEANK